MPSSHDITVFDGSGESFLLLETSNDQSNRKILPSSGYGDNNPPANGTPTNEARAEQAQPYSIVPQDDLDNEFLNSNVAQSSGKSTQEFMLQVLCKHLSFASMVFDNMF